MFTAREIQDWQKVRIMFSWGMMIRPDNEELSLAIGIALTTAKTYALRDLFSPTRAFNRTLAVETLTARVVAALGRYEITREAHAAECGDRTMPLFPELEQARQPKAGAVGQEWRGD